MNITSCCNRESESGLGENKFQKEWNRLLYFPFFQNGDSAGIDAIIPRVDVHSDAEKIYVKAELPGMEKENIDVTVEDGYLIIRGEKKQETECKDKDCLRVERFHGTVFRVIELPTAVDSAQVKATYKNGVLDLVLPRREEDKPKQIKIDVT